MKKISVLLILLILLCTIGGCTANRFNAEYDVKDFYKNAKDSYRAGQKVTLYYDFIATDTNYSFYVNDEYINCTYDYKKGYVLTFTMPEEDVYIYCKTTELMEFVE